jgi:hypothetical protein
MGGEKFNISKRKSAFRGFSLSNRVPATTTSYCRIIVWHYVKQNFGVASNVRGNFSRSLVFKTEKILIENEVTSVKINKEANRPSATFDATLMPSTNWKRIVAPGDWCAIYLYNRMETTEGKDDNTTENLVLFGNIDRVARSLQRNENDDKVQLRYQISGRNFGKVLEETDIFFDPYSIQQSRADVMLQNAGLPIQGSPDEQVSAVLDVFLGRGITTADNGRTQSLNQWTLPSAIPQLFGGDGQKFDNILDRKITSGLPGYKFKTMLNTGDNGNLWEMLKRTSNELVNEVIVEEVRTADGKVKPTIILEPRPFNTVYFESQFGKKDAKLIKRLKNKWKTIQQLAKDNFVEISPNEIVYENLGRDDHSRMNMFYLSSDTKLDHLKNIRVNANKGKGVGNPFISRESILRHGLRRYEGQMDFFLSNKNVKETQSDFELFQAFLCQVYDMNYANHLYENGTIECTGVLEAEIGKALIVKSEVNGQPDKVYYIEGYEHTWQFPGTWRTIFTVTRGQYNASGRNLTTFIDIAGTREGTPGHDFGLDDEVINNTYLTKTGTKK